MKTKLMVASAAVSISLLSTSLLAHSAEKDPMKAAVQYRQAAMSLVGANFKPMAGMVKGEIAWDDAAFAAYAKDFAAVANINHLRGYPEGSRVGHTEAAASIWKNMDDFKDKMAGFQAAATDLASAAAGGDQAAMKDAFGAAGKTCKGCHKEYKED